MAYIQGKAVQEGPKQIPANPRLYNMVRVQATSRFSKESPSKGHWIHTKYDQMGGKYVKSKKEIDPRNRDLLAEKQEKEKDKVKKKVTKPVGRGLIKGESRK
jgi:predicted acyl esterase